MLTQTSFGLLTIYMCVSAANMTSWNAWQPERGFKETVLSGLFAALCSSCALCSFSFPNDIYLLSFLPACLPSLYAPVQGVWVLHPGHHTSWDVGQMNNKKGSGISNNFITGTHTHTQTHTQWDLSESSCTTTSGRSPRNTAMRWVHPARVPWDALWKITGKTPLSVKSNDFWLCS